MSKEARVKSLVKGLQLLIILSKQVHALSLDELTIQSGLSKSSCFRLLKTLTDLNFVEKDFRSKRYRLGPRNISLGTAALSRMSLRDLAWPYMQALRDKTGETVNLCVLVGAETLIVERLDAKFILSSRSRVGSILTTLHSGCGRAIVAYLEEPKYREFLREMQISDVEKISNKWIKRTQLEIRKIRADGFSIASQEKGLAAIGCPLRDYTGEAVAAVSLSFPLSRHSIESAKRKLAPAIKHVSFEISTQLGFVQNSA